MLPAAGRVVMVSGASGGIGNAIAKCLHDKGYSVSLGARGFKPRDLMGRVQPRIIAQFSASRYVLGNPFGWRFFCERGKVIMGFVRFISNLQRIAPIDKQSGTVLQDHGITRRPGKSGQPCQAVRMPRNVLTLVLIRPGHNKPVEVLIFKLLPKCR